MRRAADLSPLLAGHRTRKAVSFVNVDNEGQKQNKKNVLFSEKVYNFTVSTVDKNLSRDRLPAFRHYAITSVRI